MSYLVDTNVLLRSAQPHHLMHKDAVSATLTLKGRGEKLCIIPQNLIEFWAVATRPVSANGLELSIADAAKELKRLKRFLRSGLTLRQSILSGKSSSYSIK
jgi:predicted nucleic acid-binding protein